jgi:peptidoglycan LD-endopeptidase LytH
MLRLLGTLLILAMAVPALAQVTEEDLADAAAEVERQQRRADQITVELEGAWQQLALHENEMASIESSMASNRAEESELETRFRVLAVERYMGAASAEGLTAMFGGDRSEVEAAFEYLRRSSGDFRQVLNRLELVWSELDRQLSRLEELHAARAEASADLENLAAEVLETLAGAQSSYDLLASERARQEEARLAEERRRAEEAARRATTTTTVVTTTTTTSATTSTAAPTTTAPTTTTPQPNTPVPPSQPITVPGGGVCPVAGPTSFTDTWGAPRSGGRTHQGVDMLAARGTPAVAIFGGTVTSMNNSTLGGISLYLTSAAGDRYFYTHLDGYAAGLTQGQSVAEGQVIGYVGSTGNAPANVPHLHFEYHPGGGVPVNPYPLVRGLCG